MHDLRVLLLELLHRPDPLVVGQEPGRLRRLRDDPPAAQRPVTDVPAAPPERALAHFEALLTFETDCWDVNAALARFKQAGRGVIVVLRDGAAGVPVQALPQDGETAAEAARTRQWREVGLGAQILKDLGVRSIRLLSSSQHTYVGLGGFGIEITETEGLEG